MDAKIFVQKFEELRQKMPRIALLSSNSENSEYTNFAYKNKNCYLAFGSHYNEDSFYLLSNIFLSKVHKIVLNFLDFIEKFLESDDDSFCNRKPVESFSISIYGKLLSVLSGKKQEEDFE